MGGMQDWVLISPSCPGRVWSRFGAGICLEKVARGRRSAGALIDVGGEYRFCVVQIYPNPVWWNRNAIFSHARRLVRQLYPGHSWQPTQRVSLVRDLLLLALMVKILIAVIYFGMEKLVLQRCG